MRDCDDGVSKTALPAKRAHVWHILSENDQEPVVHSHSFLSVLMRAEKMRSQRIEVRERALALDHARFTAGIIGLYETVLSEPIPEKMLHLIEEIGEQEHNS